MSDRIFTDDLQSLVKTHREGGTPGYWARRDMEAIAPDLATEVLELRQRVRDLEEPGELYSIHKLRRAVAHWRSIVEEVAVALSTPGEEDTVRRHLDSIKPGDLGSHAAEVWDEAGRSERLARKLAVARAEVEELRAERCVLREHNRRIHASLEGLARRVADAERERDRLRQLVSEAGND